MKKILVPVDFNPLATAALRHAAQLAQSSGAALIVMYADTFDPPAEFTAEQTGALAASIADSRRKLPRSSRDTRTSTFRSLSPCRRKFVKRFRRKESSRPSRNIGPISW